MRKESAISFLTGHGVFSRAFWGRERLLGVGVMLLLIIIPLYPKFPLFNVPGTYVAIRAEDFAVVLAVGLWLYFAAKSGFPILRERIARLILLYWLVGGVALISGVVITKNVVPHIALLHYLRRIEYMSLFFVAYTATVNLASVRKFAATLFVATSGVLLYGLGQLYLGFPVISTMNREYSKGFILKLESWARVNSTFAGHYDLAAFLVVALALISVGILTTRRRGVQGTLLLLAGGSAYLLVKTASRSSFAAAGLAITAVLIGLCRYKFILLAAVLGIALLVASPELRERYLLTFKLENLRPSGEVSKEEQPTTERAIKYSSGIRFYYEWPRALRALATNPFYGTGYSSVTLATDNDYLRALAETGILGFVAFGLIFLEASRRAALFLRSGGADFPRAVVIGIAAAMSGLLVNALFIDVFEASKIAFLTWMMLGVGIATTKLSNR